MANNEKRDSLGDRLLNRNLLVSQSGIQNNREQSFIPTELKTSKSVAPLADFDEVILKDAGIQCQRKNIGKQNRQKSDLATRLFYSGKREKASHKMYWKGRDFGRYYALDQTNRYCRPETKDTLAADETVYFNESIYNTTPKIIFRQTADRFIGFLDESKRWFDGSAICLILDHSSEYSIKYLLGLLNSSYLKAQYQNISQEAGRTFAQMKLGKLKQVQIRKINFESKKEKEMHDAVVSLVDQISSLHIKLADAKSEHARTRLEREIRATDDQLDEMVNQLYGLTIK